MKKLNILWFPALILFVFPLQGFAQIFTSEEDSFSVWFPSAPNIENSVSVSGLEVRKYKANNSQIVTELSVTELERVKYTLQMKTRIFNGIRDHVKTNLGIKVLIDRVIIISGQRGRSFKFTGDNGFGMVIDYQWDFIKDFKLYQIKIGLDLNSKEPEAVNKFFNSFKFLGNPVKPKKVAAK